MSAPTCCLARIPANGKFWLKNARVLDGLHDIRIENGHVRALVPAGDSPCCAPGLGLDGGEVCRMADGGPVTPGDPADLWVTLCGGRTVAMRGGRLETGERQEQEAINGPADGSDR